MEPLTPAQLSSLHDFHVSDPVLRWLLAKGLIEHRLETTTAEQADRIRAG